MRMYCTTMSEVWKNNRWKEVLLLFILYQMLLVLRDVMICLLTTVPETIFLCLVTIVACSTLLTSILEQKVSSSFLNIPILEGRVPAEQEVAVSRKFVVKNARVC